MLLANFIFVRLVNTNRSSVCLISGENYKVMLKVLVMLSVIND